MTLPVSLSVDAVLDHPGGSGEETPGYRLLGHSREGRPIPGFRLGSGPLHVSLIAGCHADEPVGPLLLDKWVGCLADLTRETPDAVELDLVSWWVVPHVNPDGRTANARWQERWIPVEGAQPDTQREGGESAQGARGWGYDLALYLRHVVREPPGEDLEFGFPRHVEDEGARPEAHAVAAFLRQAAPLHLHATLHGMAFAAGPWFLLEEAWVDRTADLRERLRPYVRRLGYRLHDVDRGGEKGFRRIDEGFSTRPDSRAMAAHFRERGDEATARLFRPSSMEFVRSLGGDPLTLVSEMPLFVVEEPAGGRSERPPLPEDAEGRQRFRRWLEGLRTEGDDETVRRKARDAGLRPMPLRDQMRIQMLYLQEALRAVVTDSGSS